MPRGMYVFQVPALFINDETSMLSSPTHKGMIIRSRSAIVPIAIADRDYRGSGLSGFHLT